MRAAAVPLLAGLMLAACDGAGEGGEAGTYEEDLEARTITARAPVEGGEATMLSGPAIAAALPVDIPIMPDAEVTLATHVASPDGLRIALIELTSDRSPADVAAFYRGATGEAGLNPALDLGEEDAVTYIAIGPDRSRITVHAAKALFLEDGTRAPPPPEDEAEEDESAEAAPETRSATAVQLYIIGKAADPAPAS
ncbi:hypothetical protein ACFCW2_09800 [Qipengyuania sp. DSG2-2]|uniref:hypothetical protein n=1 Tax=Qipengyuania sp. DGS2-2 TaxID=3349631 RepID=UPI0036D2F550